MKLRFILAKLIKGSAKESWKQKRSEDEAMTKRKGIVMSREAHASIGGIIEVVLWVFTTDPRIDIPIERVVVAPIAPTDIG